MSDRNIFQSCWNSCHLSISLWWLMIAERRSIDLLFNIIKCLHCHSIVLSTNSCWLSMHTWGKPRLSTTLTQRVTSPLFGDMTKTKFTEYLVYWMWSVDNEVYYKFHINVPSSHLVCSASPRAESFSSCFMAHIRPPFIQVDDNVINATVDVWTAFKSGMKDATSKKPISVSHQ